MSRRDVAFMLQGAAFGASASCARIAADSWWVFFAVFIGLLALNQHPERVPR